MSTKKYKIGQGTTVAIGPVVSGSNTVSYTTLQGAKSVGLASIETAQVEITNFGSAGMREYTPGLKEGGEVTVDLLVDAGDTQDVMLYNLLNDQTDASLRISIPNTSNTAFQITYSGFVSAYSPSVDFENVSEAQLTFKVSKVTRA